MIVKEGGEYFVKSETKENGKHKKLGGPYKTRSQALKRLREVEFFKHNK